MDVKERAAHYLSVKPRTKVQVVRYLKDKGYQEDEIRQAVEELESYGYLDDLSFSRLYFEYGFEKGRGISRIKRELSEKGVSSDVIQMAYEELEEIPDQLEAAMELGRAAVAGIDAETLSYEEKRKLQARVGRRLAGRGYPSDIVYKVIDRIL